MQVGVCMTGRQMSETWQSAVTASGSANVSGGGECGRIGRYNY